MGLLERGSEEASLDRILRAVESLPAATRCSDDEMVDDEPLPEAPALRAKAAEVYAALAQVGAKDHLGLYRKAASDARVALGRARELGFGPLVARAEYRLAMLVTALGDYGEAEELIRDVVGLAQAGGDDELAATASIQLIWNLFYQSRSAEALRLQDATRAAIARAGSTPWLQAELHSAIGAIYVSRADYPTALQQFEAALPLYEEVRGSTDYQVGRARLNVAELLKEVHRYDEALEQALRALDIARTDLGPEHPDVGRAHSVLASIHRQRGDVDQALRSLRETLRIYETALGRDALPVAKAHESLGQVFMDEKRFDEAHEHLALALELKQGREVGDVELSEALGGLGRAALELGKHEDARAHLVRALTLRESTLGTDHPWVVDSTLQLAIAYQRSGDEASAQRTLERFLKLEPTSEFAPVDRGKLLFEAAKVLEALGDPRAVELTGRAHELLVEPALEAAREVRDWLERSSAGN